MPWKYKHIGKVEGLMGQWSSSWSNSAPEHARDLILVSTGRLDLNKLRTHAVEHISKVVKFYVKGLRRVELFMK